MFAFQVVEVDFSHFSTHIDDFVNIYDGPTNTSTLLATLSGEGQTPMPNFVSGSDSMLLEFTSVNRVVTEAGWRISYVTYGEIFF